MQIGRVVGHRRRLSPRTGVLFRPSPSFALKGNVGRYFRAPDLSERFGDQGAVRGNPDLVPERGLQADASARFEHEGERGNVALEVGHFWNGATDLIVYVQNAQRTLYPVNIGRATVEGWEAAVDVSALDSIDVAGTLTWTQSENRTDDPAVFGNQLPRVPRWDMESTVSWHHDERVRVGHTFSFADGNYWDATNWYRAAPRRLEGVFVRVQPWETGPSFEGDVRNLTGQFVEVVPRNPLDPKDDGRIVQPITDYVGYPLPGRTFLFSMRWEL